MNANPKFLWQTNFTLAVTLVGNITFYGKTGYTPYHNCKAMLQSNDCDSMASRSEVHCT